MFIFEGNSSSCDDTSNDVRFSLQLAKRFNQKNIIFSA